MPPIMRKRKGSSLPFVKTPRSAGQGFTRTASSTVRVRLTQGRGRCHDPRLRIFVNVLSVQRHNQRRTYLNLIDTRADTRSGEYQFKRTYHDLKSGKTSQ